MVKLSKFYILALCTAVVLSGCGEVKKTTAQETVETVAPDVDTETTEKDPEVEDEPTEEADENVSAEKASLFMGGVDYLDPEGIPLEAGTEIAMIATNSGSDFYELLKKGAVQAVSDLNAALGYTGKEKLSLSFDAPKKESVVDQINIIDQFLDKAPDALCIAFTDASACKTQMQMAKNNGIDLIAFDTTDEEQTTSSLIASDNMAASAEAAAKMFNAVNYRGKIAVIVHNSLKQTGQDRYRAITNELAEKYANKDLRFVDVVYLAQDNREEEMILDELLEKHPDLSGIICTDMETTEMVIDYAENIEDRKFQIVGFDLSDKIADAVENGLVLGTVAQDPYHMGYATVIAAARSICGMSNAETIYTDHLWVDSSNVNSEEVLGLLEH